MKFTFGLFNRSAAGPSLAVGIMVGLTGCVVHNPAVQTPASTDATAASRLTGEWTRHRTRDGAHPDQHEQQLLWLMNRARSNPASEGQWLAATTIPEIAKPRTQFKVHRRKLERKFNDLPVRPPAAFDVRLYNAAKKHARKMIRKRTQSHNGQMQDIKASGYKLSTCRGNVYSYAKSALNAHAAFNIDWGKGWGGTQKGAGHRTALMAAKEELSSIGIAGLWVEATDKVGPYVVVGNYCTPMEGAQGHYRRFVVGTVFVDANNNDFFDPGEGVPNVRVDLGYDNLHAITSAGGGYAIPATRAGPVSVVFSSSLGTHRRKVHVSAQSVLVDLKL